MKGMKPPRGWVYLMLAGVHYKRASIPPAYRDERYVTDFSVSLTRIRRQRGMSQTALARAIGVTRPAVSRMEAGASNPSLAVLVALADALGCTIDELCGRTNP
jgi:DNA-binding XRE family transcriptional regulator